MKFIFLIEYCIYLIYSIDARMLKESRAFQTGHGTIMTLFFIVSFINIFLFVVLPAFIRHKNAKITLFYLSLILILLLFCCSLFRDRTDLKEAQAQLLFIATIILDFIAIDAFNCFSEFLLVSELTPALYMAWSLFKNQISVSSVFKNINVSVLFATQYSLRIRNRFGFYNENAAGILATNMICLSLLVMSICRSKKENRIWSKLVFPISIICGLLWTLIFFGSASRTAMLSLCFFILGYMWCKIDQIKGFVKVQLKVIKIIVLITMAIIVFYMANGGLYTDYLNSGRYRSFNNLSLLNTIQQKLFGLGVITPYDIRFLMIGDGHGDILDNYYIYIVVSFGIIGFVIFLAMFIVDGMSLYRYSANSDLLTIVFCWYAMSLLYGIGETCILYYLFPTSLISFSIFFYCIHKRGKVDIMPSY